MVSAAARSAVPVGMGDLDIHDQPVAVLHEDVSHVAQARFVGLCFLEQPRIGVRGAGVGVVAAFLTSVVPDFVRSKAFKSTSDGTEG